MKFLIAILTLVSLPIYAIEVAEIVAKANAVSYYKGDDGKAKVKMEIKDSAGNIRTRNFVILRKDTIAGKAGDGGDQMFYVYFRRPADVNKTVFLVQKHTAITRDDDRWLYLPALDLVKRIAASDKRTSFVGSDFFYEDVSGRNLSDDTHELLEETDTYYILKSIPKNLAGIEFAEYKSWVHKKTFLPIKVEYTDKNGKIYRTAKVLKVKNVQGYPTVMAATMQDNIRNSTTTMTYSGVKYDMDIPANIFTERYLRNPPRKLLR